MDEEKRNLKGNKDHLEYFRTVETGNLEPRLKLLSKENDDNLKSKLYYYPEKDRVKFSEDEVRKFSLDKYGENIPYVDGEMTIFNNYFFDYWSYYLNPEGLALYGHLKRFAYGNKDWCFPNFELISLKMDKTRPTIHNYMDLLERYGFAYKFNVVNRSRDGAEEGPVFKLRKQVPLLTETLIKGNPDLEIPENCPPHIKKAIKKERKGLPERLRKDHEKYLKNMMNYNINIQRDIDFENIYRQWQQFGELIKKSRKSNKVKSVQQVNGYNNMDESEKILLDIIKSYISGKISKPSFDTWFSNILLKKEHQDIIILAPNEFAKDWLEDKYDTLIKDALKEYEQDFDNIYFKLI